MSDDDLCLALFPQSSPVHSVWAISNINTQHRTKINSTVMA